MDKGAQAFSCKLRHANYNSNTLFNQLVAEAMSDVDHPRYLLKMRGLYFCVPSYFSKNKQTALRLAAQLEEAASDVALFYTKSPEGRRALIDAYMRQHKREVIEEKVWE